MLQAENNNTTVTFEYDIEGKLVKEKQGFDFVLENVYDITGQRTKRITKQRGKEKVVDYSFSPSGLPQAININGKEVVNLQYDRFGKLYKEKLGSLEKFYQYDNENRLSSQKLYGETGEIFKTEYNYDNRGNLQERKDSINGNDSYIYDPVGRIIRYTDPLRVTREMVKDPAGNYLQTKVVETEDSFKRVGDYRGVHYEFDKAGNLTERDNLKLKWDSNNRLIQTEKEEQITRYKYDSFGRRISKETDGTETKFYWEGNTLISDTERDFHYYPYSFEPLIMEADNNIYYYHNDLNGAPLRLTNEQGKVVWNAHYDVLGNVDKLSIKEVHNPIRMQGQYEDQETGLYYNRYRYFDANICAYVSQDPLGLLAGSNVYSYPFNPLRYTDPLGLKCPELGTGDEPKVTEKKTHGNSKSSTKKQHGYEIKEKATGDVGKTGISGQDLNKNGSSPRANSQVNKLNKEAGYEKYEATVVETDLENRSIALEWEENNAQKLWDEGNSMNIHKRPKPWE